MKTNEDIEKGWLSKKELLLIFLAVCFLTVWTLLPLAEADISPINQCGLDLRYPNTYYVLTNDLEYKHEGNCLSLGTGDNITLDCQGHSITCVTAEGCDGSQAIVIWEHEGTLTIKNCHIKGFFQGITTYARANDVLIKDNYLDHNYHSFVVRSKNVKIEGNTVEGNKVEGMPGSGCGLYTWEVSEVFMKDNYMCNDFNPGCFNGRQVFYCEPGMFFKDLGGNTLPFQLTNCPFINPSSRSCLTKK